MKNLTNKEMKTIVTEVQEVEINGVAMEVIDTTLDGVVIDTEVNEIAEEPTTEAKEDKKLTKKDYFAKLLAIKEVKENKSLVEFINHEIELLQRKASKSKDGKPNKTQEENAVLKNLIIAVLTGCDTHARITEIQAKEPKLAEFSNQKMSALLKQLIAEGEVTKVVEKRVSYFKLA